MLRDRGSLLPSDADLEDCYADATLGAAYWMWGENVFYEIERNVNGLLAVFREVQKEETV
jgi:hypothetical protein